MQEVKSLRVSPLIRRPKDQRGGNTILSEHVVRPLRGIERIAPLVEEVRSIEHIYLLLIAPSREQD